MKNRVDWNELDGALSFAPGSKVLYNRRDQDADTETETISAIVECADGTVVNVLITAQAFPMPERAPTHVRRRLREAGRLRR